MFGAGYRASVLIGLALICSNEGLKLDIRASVGADLNVGVDRE